MQFFLLLFQETASCMFLFLVCAYELKVKPSSVSVGASEQRSPALCAASLHRLGAACTLTQSHQCVCCRSTGAYVRLHSKIKA